MSLADDIERMVHKGKEPSENEPNQLSMLDEVEHILKKLGVSLETRFEIPLSRRIHSRQTEKNA